MQFVVTLWTPYNIFWIMVLIPISLMQMGPPLSIQQLQEVSPYVYLSLSYVCLTLCLKALYLFVQSDVMKFEPDYGMQVVGNKKGNGLYLYWLCLCEAIIMSFEQEGFLRSMSYLIATFKSKKTVMIKICALCICTLHLTKCDMYRHQSSVYKTQLFTCPDVEA